MWLLPGSLIGIEASLDGVRRQSQRLSADGRFQCLGVQILQALAAQQRFDVPQDLKTFCRCATSFLNSGVVRPSGAHRLTARPTIWLK